MFVTQYYMNGYLEAMAQYPGNLAVSKGNSLIPSDKETTPEAQKLIYDTINDAIAIEVEYNEPFWMKRGNKVISLSGIAKERTSPLLEKIMKVSLEDDRDTVLTVELTYGEHKTPYTVNIGEGALRECQTIHTLLEEEIDVIPCGHHSMSKEQLDLAFGYIETGHILSPLSLEDCAALLKFALLMNHPRFIKALVEPLKMMPLNKEVWVTLPEELIIKWARARPGKECAAIIESFEGKDIQIKKQAATLLNNKCLNASDFQTFDNLKKTVDISEIEVLDLSGWRSLTLEEFKAILDACPTIKELYAPENFSDRHLALIKTLSSLKILDLSQQKLITNEGLAHLPPSLQELDLSWDHQITDPAIKHLERLPNLLKLELGIHHSMSIQALNSIKCSLPKLAISEDVDYLCYY